MPRLRSNAPLVLSLLVALALVPRPTRADRSIVVGNGTATSCTEAALRDALLLAETIGGATVGFRCGHAPVTIALSHVTEMPGISVFLVIPDSTTVDGAGLVALERGVVPGGGEAALVFVAEGTTAQLKGLSILNAVAPTRFAGGVVNLGTLTISESTVSGHSNHGGGAGGIWNAGRLGMVESVVSDNTGVAFGAGIFNRGALTVEQSLVTRNTASVDGGGIYNCVEGDALCSSTATTSLAHTTVTENAPGDVVP